MKFHFRIVWKELMMHLHLLCVCVQLKIAAGKIYSIQNTRANPSVLIMFIYRAYTLYCTYCVRIEKKKNEKRRRSERLTFSHSHKQFHLPFFAINSKQTLNETHEWFAESECMYYRIKKREESKQAFHLFDGILQVQMSRIVSKCIAREQIAAWTRGHAKSAVNDNVNENCFFFETATRFLQCIQESHSIRNILWKKYVFKSI